MADAPTHVTRAHEDDSDVSMLFDPETPDVDQKSLTFDKARELAAKSWREEVLEDPFFKTIHTPGKARRMQSYLIAFARIGYTTHAAYAVGIKQRQVQVWRKEYPEFARFEERCQMALLEAMEREVDRRAFKGYLEPVFSQRTGGTIGHIRKFSDNLAVQRLRALGPDKYADRKKTEISGPMGGPVQLAAVKERLDEKLQGLRKQHAVVPDTIASETDPK